MAVTGEGSPNARGDCGGAASFFFCSKIPLGGVAERDGGKAPSDAAINAAGGC